MLVNPANRLSRNAAIIGDLFDRHAVMQIQRARVCGITFSCLMSVANPAFATTVVQP
jgi:hypothetical protein